MISFKILTPESLGEILTDIFENIPTADREYTSDTLRLFSEDDRGYEYAISHSHGCLLFRKFDDEYTFSYPMKICDSSDPVKAALEIRAYAVKEEIPLFFYDVRNSEVGSLVTNFRHVSIDAQDRNGWFYEVRVLNELMLTDEIPEYIDFFGFSLTPFTPEDDEDYARLCMDKESNEFWGYDYSEDEPNPDKSYFREVAETEYEYSRALCLALRYKGEFLGEGTLYYFDYMGGCECAVRILPEHRKKGYASRAMHLLKTIARRMGVVYLKASVDIRNAASLRLTEKFLYEEERTDSFVNYKIDITHIN